MESCRRALAYDSVQNKRVRRHPNVEASLFPDLSDDSLGETFSNLQPSPRADPFAIPETTPFCVGVLDQKNSAFPVTDYTRDGDRDLLFPLCPPYHLALPAFKFDLRWE